VVIEQLSMQSQLKNFGCVVLFVLQKDERARDTVTVSVASKQQRVKSKLDAEKDEHRYNMKK